MAQVSRTTNDLIINALYLNGELGVGEPPDAFMLSQGLELLNELIGKFTADGVYIPFLTKLTFNLVPGQATYSIGDINNSDIHSDRIVDIAFANYKVDTIVYPLVVISKAQFYNVTRLTNFSTRPGIVFLDRQPYQSFITFYPAPDRAYVAEIQAKVMLDKLDAHEGLDSIPPYYYGFLKYALARKFNQIYPSTNWTQQAESEYNEYYENLKNANETNLVIDPSSTLTSRNSGLWWRIQAY